MKTNNPILEKGDRVVLIYMDPSVLTPKETIAMKYGEKGVVLNVANVMGTLQYSIKWDNGRHLSLLDDTDIFMKEDDFDVFINRKKNKIKEHYSITKKKFIDLINKNRYL